MRADARPSRPHEKRARAAARDDLHLLPQGLIRERGFDFIAARVETRHHDRTIGHDTAQHRLASGISHLIWKAQSPVWTEAWCSGRGRPIAEAKSTFDGHTNTALEAMPLNTTSGCLSVTPPIEASTS